MIKEQLVTENYAIYNADCMDVISNLPDDSVGLSVYSPPFAGLYNYSSNDRDFSNCSDIDEFLEMYECLVEQMARVTKPGRINCVHCTDIMNSKTESLWDFPHEIIRIHEKYGFEYKNRITIWKEPMGVRLRTMVRSLMHVTMIEDATSCYPAMPDYLLVFRKKGECVVPVTHDGGLKHYFGDLPLLPLMMDGGADGKDEDFTRLSNEAFRNLQRKYWNFEGDHKENKLSHVIYRRYMSSVWDDIRISNVLQFEATKDPDDEKHVHPLQLDVIDRCVALWSNKGDIVLTPFMGVGSEVYSPVSLGRFGIGAELKPSYYKQAVKNMAGVSARYMSNQIEMF